MKTFKVHEKSWHARLLTTYRHTGQLSTYPDICSYTRGVIWTIILVTWWVTIASILFGISFGDLFTWLFWMAINGAYVDPHDGAVIAVCLTIFLASLWAYIYLREKWDTHLERKRAERLERMRNAPETVEEEMKPKEPWFIVQAYRSWKEKYCMKIEVVS
jgi:hypothetical protein